MPQVLSCEQHRELLATVWPADSWSRRACSGIWLAQVLPPSFPRLISCLISKSFLTVSQDLCPVIAHARNYPAAALRVAVPLLPQRFNGPCGLLAAVQAEMLVVAADAEAVGSNNVLGLAVERMLQRAARANGATHIRCATRLLCSACGNALAAFAPVEDGGGNDHDVEVVTAGAAAAGCSCGCPPSLPLSWSGRLWCTLQVLTLLLCSCQLCCFAIF